MQYLLFLYSGDSPCHSITSVCLVSPISSPEQGSKCTELARLARSENVRIGRPHRGHLAQCYTQGQGHQEANALIRVMFNSRLRISHKAIK